MGPIVLLIFQLFFSILLIKSFQFQQNKLFLNGHIIYIDIGGYLPLLASAKMFIF